MPFLRMLKFIAINIHIFDIFDTSYLEKLAIRSHKSETRKLRTTRIYQINILEFID